MLFGEQCHLAPGRMTRIRLLGEGAGDSKPVKQVVHT